MHLPKIAIVLGMVLVVLGLTFYFMSDPIRQFVEGDTISTTTQAIIVEGALTTRPSPVVGHKPSPTALIPAFIGAVLLLLGLVAMVMPASRKHAMHVATLISLLGLAGSASGVLKLVRYLADALPQSAALRPVAWIAQTVTAVVLAIFLVTAISSFRAARKAREQL